MADLVVSPALVLLAGALLVALVPRAMRALPLLVVPLAAGAALYLLPAPPDSGPLVLGSTEVLGYTLEWLEISRLGRVFAIILVAITFIGSVFALHVERRGEHVAALVYAGSSVGVVLAGDWITLFVFWELMAVSSTFLVWFRKDRESIASGYRYFLVHAAGGGLLLSGILLHLSQGGSSDLAPLAMNGAASWLILVGVGINAGIVPLHAWLPDAYSRATLTGAVFMCALTTKTAVFVLLKVFAGAEVLIAGGVIMALYGVVFAVLENDIRRLLAYHIVSQVGYMVAAVGMGTPLAVNGATAHAFCHILYKSVLFMGAGAVIYATGKHKLTELGGIARKVPAVLVLYAVGAMSISGFPLFNGFVSKSMVVSAAAAGEWHWVELSLTLASVGTFLHTGLKLLYFTFLGEDRGIEVRAVPLNMRAGMLLGAVGCIFFGVFYGVLYDWLPHADEAASYVPYTLDHVVQMLQLLVATAVVFWFLIGKLGGEATITLDTDWPYRKLLPGLLTTSQQLLSRLSDATARAGRFGGARFDDATHALVHRMRLRRDPAAPADEVADGAPAYGPDADRFPLSVTVGSALVVFSLIVALHRLLH